MKDNLQQVISDVVRQLFDIKAEVSLARPDQKMGDYTCNIAMKLSAQLGKPPLEIAGAIAEALAKHEAVASAEVAGPGFVNITVSDTQLARALHESFEHETYRGKTIVAEYSDPNPFKVLHAGHLYTSVVGDAIANLLAHTGATVHRVNFGGDVGLHVGKTMWAMLQKLGGEQPSQLADIAEAKRSEWMAACYVQGSTAYEDDAATKAEIIELNKKVYQLHGDNDHESPFAEIYWTCRQWSYDYFDSFYARIGSGFERYYPESETAEIGLEAVKKHTGEVFEHSDGAVIFDGEKYGLHPRVFITSDGLPTYETKDVGLILKKHRDYNFDHSVVITDNSQQQYMQVVLKAIEQFAPELSAATKHITHGTVKLAGGVKMASRLGNILRAVDVLDAAAEANKVANDSDNEVISLGAIKYAFLQQRIGGDIVYDPKESVALHGRSGPYLQYAYVRAHKVLAQCNKDSGDVKSATFDTNERLLASKLSEYNEVLERAVDELLPHHVAQYLYELAQVFNRFYETSRIVGDPRQNTRVALVKRYADVLREGLALLGVEVPDKM